MANTHRREVAIELEGKKRIMTPTLEACINLEDELGRGLMDILTSLRDRADGGAGALKIKEIASVLRWGIWGAEGGPKPLDAEPMLAIVWAERGQGRLPILAGKALGFVVAALNVDDPERAESDSVKK